MCGKNRELGTVDHACACKQLGEAELYNLKAAASGLARMPKATLDAERHHYGAPPNALDRLLSDMSTGKT